jgi:hypothetical protein
MTVGQASMLGISCTKRHERPTRDHGFELRRRAIGGAIAPLPLAGYSVIRRLSLY